MTGLPADAEAREILGASADCCSKRLAGIADPLLELAGAVQAIRDGDVSLFVEHIGVARVSILALRETWKLIEGHANALAVLGMEPTPEEAREVEARTNLRCGQIMLRGLSDADARRFEDAHHRACHDPNCVTEASVRAALRAREAGP